MITTKIKEITEKQFRKATEEHDATDIFSIQEVCGYGIYGEYYYKKDGKYYVKYQIGTSCD